MFFFSEGTFNRFYVIELMKSFLYPFNKDRSSMPVDFMNGATIHCRADERYGEVKKGSLFLESFFKEFVSKKLFTESFFQEFV